MVLLDKVIGAIPEMSDCKNSENVIPKNLKIVFPETTGENDVSLPSIPVV